MTTAKAILLLALASAGGAYADRIHLVKGDPVEGSVQSMDRTTLVVKLSDGSTRKIPKAELQRIEFVTSEKKAPGSADSNFLSALNRNESKYGTPLKTFEMWRTAAISGEIDRIVACYASTRQKEVRKQLKKLSKDAREKMRDATAQTQFVPSEPLYQGDRAFLEVNWTKGLEGESQVLQFILEKDDWKLIQ